MECKGKPYRPGWYGLDRRGWIAEGKVSCQYDIPGKLSGEGKNHCDRHCIGHTTKDVSRIAFPSIALGRRCGKYRPVCNGIAIADHSAFLLRSQFPYRRVTVPLVYDTTSHSDRGNLGDTVNRTVRQLGVSSP